MQFYKTQRSASAAYAEPFFTNLLYPIEQLGDSFQPPRIVSIIFLFL